LKSKPAAIASKMLHMLVALKIAALRSSSRIARLREISKEQRDQRLTRM
jgi:hypothetical protein